MRAVRLAILTCQFLSVGIPSIALASAPEGELDTEPEAPFSVACNQNGNGVGGYLVRVESFSQTSIKIFDLLINDRFECSTVQVIRIRHLRDEQNLTTSILNNPAIWHAAWFRSGKAIIDSDATYQAIPADRTLNTGKPLLWQTACMPSDVKITTSAGYAEFKFNATLPTNPGPYFGVRARKIPRLMTPQRSFGW